jgi:multidrug efflux pump
VFPLETGGLAGRSGGRPVQVVIGAATHEDAGAYQEAVLARLRDVPGLVAPRGDYQPTRPELRLDIDRSRAADLGVSVQAISRTLETMLGSAEITTFVDRGEEYEVIVQGREDQRSTPNDLTNLYVRSDTTQALIPLSNLVSMREIASPGSLRRFARMPAATIEAGLVPGYALGTALDSIEEVAREVLPETAHLDYKGASREFHDSSSAAYFSFALALLIVFLVLAAQFESFAHPFVIMLTVPLAVAGGLFGLWVSGGSLNIYTQIGMTILIGLAAKNGILIVEFANQLRERGLAFEDAVREAALTRLRPILMTSIATAIGAVPLFVRSGPGSGGRGAIGVVVFAGVMLATFFTLFVVPVAYSVIARRTKLPGSVAHELDRLEREVPAARAEVPAVAGGD